MADLIQPWGLGTGHSDHIGSVRVIARGNRCVHAPLDVQLARRGAFRPLAHEICSEILVAKTDIPLLASSRPTGGPDALRKPLAGHPGYASWRIVW
ncbi:MAG: hypothetical protein QOF90_391 [Acetobacteraceae bacterium]|nr:hypothetical protein [Acetobacteraceae bacterium]